jgi:glycosyltransferase involved in cell wall biosynthesis
MKLLIITQKADRNDPVLGFFHGWIRELSLRYEKVSVICLEKGEVSLPENASVHSLGKEEGLSSLGYLWRFYKYVWSLRGDYDAVFVHMNQEYVLLGYKHWLLMGKKIYLWRNHAKGSFVTRLAVLLCDKVFCTSPDSYTAKFKKTILMPAGIDTDLFTPDAGVSREPGSILFLGRIAPVKRVIEFIEWLAAEKGEGKTLSATVAGSALPKDKRYENQVHERAAKLGLSSSIRFVGPVTQEGALSLYQSHEKYVNMTPSGSLDKTILEAAACGMEITCENPFLKERLEGKPGTEARQYVIDNHSLKMLSERLLSEIK